MFGFGAAGGPDGDVVGVPVVVDADPDSPHPCRNSASGDATISRDRAIDLCMHASEACKFGPTAQV